MRKAGDVIFDLLKNRFGNDFAETARSSAELFGSWEMIVRKVWPHQVKDGIPTAAVHSRIRELERGVLLVEADHPGWVQILQTKQSELLKAVQRSFPDVHGIAFTLSRGLRPEVLADKKIISGLDQEIPLEGINVSETDSAVPLHGRVRDDEFYTALSRLEKAVRERNG